MRDRDALVPLLFLVLHHLSEGWISDFWLILTVVYVIVNLLELLGDFKDWRRTKKLKSY